MLVSNWWPVCLLIDAEWRTDAPENKAIVGSDNNFFLISAKPLFEPIVAYCLMETWGQSSVQLKQTCIFPCKKMNVNMSSTELSVILC